VRRSAAKELVDVDQSKKPRMPLSCAVFSVSADFTLSTSLLILAFKRRTKQQSWPQTAKAKGFLFLIFDPHHKRMFER
jgi:hypothetical protein